MVDTLSQNEIDALLSALQPSEDAVAATPDTSQGVAISASTNNNSKDQTPSLKNEVANISSKLSNNSFQENAASSSTSSKSKGKERKAFSNPLGFD